MKNKYNEIKFLRKVSLKKILLFFSIIGIVFIALFVLFVFKKEKVKNNIEVNELTYVVPLVEENEVEAAKIIKKNIVKIINKIDDDTSIVGTGFFIEDGYLITNSHIVDIMGNITIEYCDGTVVPAYLYSNSIEHDIALLKVEKVRAKALSFGNSNNKEVTTDVLAAGYIYNFAGEATVSKGSLAARRYIDSFTYLQSDISIDTGSSGGPMFDATAAVIAINVYVTENRTFALSLSSESLDIIIEALLDTPTITYLKEERPSNSINSILVEVGYTDNANLDLYNDYDKIKKSNKEHKSDKSDKNDKNDKNEEPKKDNTIDKPVDKIQEEKYYCDDGYQLVGKKCVRQVQYSAFNKPIDCKEGYTKKNDYCVKIRVVDAEENYTCDGTLTENKTCIEQALWESGFATYYSRWGSCPKGKECYDEGVDTSIDTTYKTIFVSEMKCPVGTTKIYSGEKIVWSNEELNLDNFKIWNSSKVGALRKVDSDKLVYYESGVNVLSLCAKYDFTNEVYVASTFDELKDVACPDGGTLMANTNNQGFYCKLDVNPHLYSWDVSCKDTSFSVMTKLGGNRIICGKWVETERVVTPWYRCNEGILLPDGKTCQFEERYTLPDNFVCNEGDILDGQVCLKNEIIDAKKGLF